MWVLFDEVKLLQRGNYKVIDTCLKIIIILLPA